MKVIIIKKYKFDENYFKNLKHIEEIENYKKIYLVNNEMRTQSSNITEENQLVRRNRNISFNSIVIKPTSQVKKEEPKNDRWLTKVISILTQFSFFGSSLLVILFIILIFFVNRKRN
jgi:hypothetical protein